MNIRQNLPRALGVFGVTIGACLVAMFLALNIFVLEQQVLVTALGCFMIAAYLYLLSHFGARDGAKALRHDNIVRTALARGDDRAASEGFRYRRIDGLIAPLLAALPWLLLCLADALAALLTSGTHPLDAFLRILLSPYIILLISIPLGSPLLYAALFLVSVPFYFLGYLTAPVLLRRERAAIAQTRRSASK